MPQFSADELQQLIEQASWLALNDYEAFLLSRRMGCDRAARRFQVRGMVVTLGEKGAKSGRRGLSSQSTPSSCRSGRSHRLRRCLARRLAALLQQGWDLLRCARLGNYMGAVKVATTGPQNYRINADEVQTF